MNDSCHADNVWSRSHVTWLNHTCDMTQHVIWINHTCDMTYSNMSHLVNVWSRSLSLPPLLSLSPLLSFFAATWDPSRMWMSHITFMIDSFHMYEYHVTHMKGSYRTFGKDMAHRWMSHGTRINMVNSVPYHKPTEVAQLVRRLHTLIVCSVTGARQNPQQLQGGEDSSDPLSGRSFSTKEPLNIGHFLRKMTHKDKGSYEGSPPCIPRSLIVCNSYTIYTFVTIFYLRKCMVEICRNLKVSQFVTHISFPQQVTIFYLRR